MRAHRSVLLRCCIWDKYHELYRIIMCSAQGGIFYYTYAWRYVLRCHGYTPNSASYTNHVIDGRLWSDIVAIAQRRPKRPFFIRG